SGRPALGCGGCGHPLVRRHAARRRWAGAGLLGFAAGGGGAGPDRAARAACRVCPPPFPRRRRTSGARPAPQADPRTWRRIRSGGDVAAGRGARGGGGLGSVVGRADRRPARSAPHRSVLDRRPGLTWPDLAWARSGPGSVWRVSGARALTSAVSPARELAAWLPLTPLTANAHYCGPTGAER